MVRRPHVEPPAVTPQLPVKLPVINPPIQPPVNKPPVIDPPVCKPPGPVKPPVIDPPVQPPIKPPVIDPPVCKPPVKPPIVDGGNKVEKIEPNKSSNSDLSVILNGVELKTKGYKRDREEMVALREVFEALGATVNAVSVKDNSGNITQTEVTITGEGGRTAGFTVYRNSTTFAGWVSSDGENKETVSLTAENKGGKIFVSSDFINHLYAVKIKSKDSKVTIESKVEVIVNGDEKSVKPIVRDHNGTQRAFAPVSKILKAVGAEIKSVEYDTVTAVKGDTRIRVFLSASELDITRNGKTTTYKTLIKNIDKTDMIDVASLLPYLPDTTYEWDKVTGKMEIDTEEFRDWEQRAGEFLFEALEIGFDFLFGDIVTAFNPKADPVDRFWAFLSFTPIGKVGKFADLLQIIKKYSPVDWKKFDNLKGDIRDLKTVDEKVVVHDLLSAGRQVEVLPSTSNPGGHPDLKVDGVLTEIKTLNGSSQNTAVTRIQKGFEQGALAVILDGRKVKLSAKDAQTILNRAAGSYPDKKLPGKVEIWTDEGIITQ